MRATVHDDFTMRVTPPGPMGMMNIIFRDIDEEGRAMGFQEVYPVDKDQAIKFADELKKKALDLEVPDTPVPTNLRSIDGEGA